MAGRRCTRHPAGPSSSVPATGAPYLGLSQRGRRSSELRPAVPALRRGGIQIHVAQRTLEHPALHLLPDLGPDQAHRTLPEVVRVLGEEHEDRVHVEPLPPPRLDLGPQLRVRGKGRRDEHRGDLPEDLLAHEVRHRPEVRVLRQRHAVPGTSSRASGRSPGPGGGSSPPAGRPARPWRARTRGTSPPSRAPSWGRVLNAPAPVIAPKHFRAPEGKTDAPRPVGPPSPGGVPWSPSPFLQARSRASSPRSRPRSRSTRSGRGRARSSRTRSPRSATASTSSRTRRRGRGRPRSPSPPRSSTPAARGSSSSS